MIEPGGGINYGGLLGANIDQQQGRDDPFGGKIPTDAKGYRMFQTYYENVMLQAIENMGTVSISFCCESTGPGGKPIRLKGAKPSHVGGGVVFACNHAIHQDPVNPEGIYFMPLGKDGAGYYLCKYCNKSFQAHRLDMDEIKGKCALCVLETIERVQRTHPDRLFNLLAM